MRRWLLILLTLGGCLAAPRLVPIPALPPSSPSPTLPEILPVNPSPATPVPKSSLNTINGSTEPLFSQQWNLGIIGMPEAWTLLQKRSSLITVAVLDTGFVDTPELSGRVVSGYDFVSDALRSGDGDGRDADASGIGPLSYHAEVVANIIGAAHDGQGMAGINPQARIVQVRVADVEGQINVTDLVDGLRWAAGLPVSGVPANPFPAKILNLSLFADFIPLTRCDPRVQVAIDAITARGALVIAGAANDGQDAAGYSPAGCRQVLTVTSVTAQGQRPSYANWGQSVQLAAPGGSNEQHLVVSSQRAAGQGTDGTSFAAPQVSGVASLLLAERPRLRPSQLRDLLIRYSTPFPGGRCDPEARKSCGQGTLNAAASLRAALGSAVGQ